MCECLFCFFCMYACVFVAEIHFMIEIVIEMKVRSVALATRPIVCMYVYNRCMYICICIYNFIRA